MYRLPGRCGSGKSIGGKMLEPENGSEPYIFFVHANFKQVMIAVSPILKPCIPT